jgi:hypothetical protein
MRRPQERRVASGAVVLVAIVALALPAGCNGTNTGPTTTASAATASPDRTTRPSARPSTAPSADPGTAAVRTFVAFATSPKATYQGTFSGDSRQTITVIKITKGTFAGTGKDALVRGTFTFPDGNSGVVEHRYVKEVAWFRVGTRPWQKLPGFTADNSMGAFAFVHGAADVTYLGPKTVSGKHLFQVAIPSAIVSPVMIPESNLTEPALTSSKLTLLIDANGRPVSGVAQIIGRGRVSKQLQEIAIDLTVTFTKVGQPVSITAP